MRLSFIISICLSAIICRGQKTRDLYAHVDSIVRHQLKFQGSDPCQNKPSDQIAVSIDSTRRKPFQCSASLKKPTYPLILINNQVVDVRKLKGISMSFVSDIFVMVPSTPTSAIYGIDGTYGVIIIRGSEKLKRIFKKSASKEQP